MKTITSHQPCSIHSLCQPLKSMLFLTLLGAVIFLGITAPAQADIYKWRDAAGVIYYSNHPPADLSRILEIIPSQNATADSGDDPKVYYFSAPDGQTHESFTVPPDVLQELFGEQMQTAAPALPLSDSPNLTALTMRLAEIEKTLQQEVETRVRWQQQYAQAQSVIKTLEQQNRTLNIAMATMEEDMDFLRGTVVASDMEVAALKQRVQPGQYAMLTNTVTGMQEQVQTIALELETLNAPALSQKIALLAADIRSIKIQQQPDDNLQLRLASLESDMQHIAETQPGSRHTADVVARLEANGQALSNISTYQERRLKDQEFQIAALKAELDEMKTSRVQPDNEITTFDGESQILVAQLIENNQSMEAMLKQQAQTLQAQNEQMKAIQAQLPLAQISDAISTPTSGIRIIPRMERRRTSLFVRFATWLATPQPQMEE